jgi:hypothetical protein
MATAKMKLFTGGDPQKIEFDINQWLSKLSDGVIVQRSETALSAVETSKGGPLLIIVISVWYVESSN